MWTIASYSPDEGSGKCNVWIIEGYSKGTGMLTTRNCEHETGYKPVFYTNGFVTFEFGSGKNDNPFIIKID